MCPFGVRVPPWLSLAGFLGGKITRAVSAPRRDWSTVGSQLGRWTCLPPSLPTPFNLPFRRQAALSRPRRRIAHGGSTGMLTRSAIGISVRMSLRSRLTLIRLALIRKPWSFGEGVSRPLYRYLYLHLLFQTLQSGSRRAFDADWNAPLPIHKGSRSFGGALIPDYYPRRVPRPVSCYALFE